MEAAAGWSLDVSTRVVSFAARVSCIERLGWGGRRFWAVVLHGITFNDTLHRLYGSHRVRRTGIDEAWIIPGGRVLLLMGSMKKPNSE